MLEFFICIVVRCSFNTITSNIKFINFYYAVCNSSMSVLLLSNSPTDYGMYFLEKEASNHGLDPAALEPAAGSRKEGRLFRSLEGEGFSHWFCCYKFRARMRKQ